MIDVTGVNMFDPFSPYSPYYNGDPCPECPPIYAWCITTNGTIKKNGCAVLGAGVAKIASSMWPTLPLDLGSKIKTFGNNVHTFVVPVSRGDNPASKWLIQLVTFPVKHNWFEKADISLIRQSAQQLDALANRMGWKHVVIPRHGCGNGQLNWDDVGPVLSTILDDRFSVITL